MHSLLRTSSTLLAVYIIIVIATPTAMAADELELHAGNDKVIKVSEQVYFNEATIIKPDPRDPDRTYSFRWDFDDTLDVNMDGITDNDGESHEQFTSWRYNLPGIYDVTLTVTDSINVAKDTIEVKVVENYPPDLFVEGDHVTAMGVPIQLNVTANDLDDEVDSLMWEWDLGDGCQSEMAGPLIHTYHKLGELQVWVRVADPSGDQVATSFNVTVVDGTRPSCNAGTDVTITVNGTVLFNGMSSHDNVGVTRWTWTFGYDSGQVVMEGPEPEFTFRTIGTYIIGLRVYDDAGNEDWDTMIVLVNPEHVDGDEPDGSWTVTAPGTDRMWQSIVMSALIVSSLAISLGVNLKRRSADSSERDFEVFFRIRGRRSD
ncbi:MAG: PKD domain-containing protein [Thermoplasmata archaeon]|nr:PKD domain-containing protein [Thermoplasmata archaeon]